MIKNWLNHLGVWTIKHHWIFLLAIIGLQWLTGQVLEEPLEWRWLINPILARQLHLLNSKVILALLIYMAFNKLWLWLKRSGKI